GEIAAGQVDHAGGVVEVVGAHGANVHVGGVEAGEQLFAGVFDAAAVGYAVADVVIVHQFVSAFERAVAVGVADGREEEGEVAGAVGEDAQVPVNHLPENAEAVPPGEKLRESVIREGLGKGSEIRIEDGPIGKLNRSQAPTREGVFVHKIDGFLQNNPSIQPDGIYIPWCKLYRQSTTFGKQLWIYQHNALGIPSHKKHGRPGNTRLPPNSGAAYF
ncbi:MAG: hypothetical protein JWL69_2527, partial [Phycisphaerales bacterium]|nr:hypothetical protein [Phycisphaerales bacterium]